MYYIKRILELLFPKCPFNRVFGRDFSFYCRKCSEKHHIAFVSCREDNLKWEKQKKFKLDKNKSCFLSLFLIFMSCCLTIPYKTTSGNLMNIDTLPKGTIIIKADKKYEALKDTMFFISAHSMRAMVENILRLEIEKDSCERGK